MRFSRCFGVPRVILFRALVVMFLGIVISAQVGVAAEKSERDGFDAVASKLQTGGNLYLYISASDWFKELKAAGESIKKIFRLSRPSMFAPKQEDVAKGVDFALALIKSAGMDELSGVGASSVLIGDGLYHGVVFFHHWPENNKGMIWNAFGDKDRVKEAMALAPDDTAAMFYTGMDLRLLWNWFKEQATKSGIRELIKAVNNAPSELKKKDIDLERFLDCFGGSLGVFLVLDKNRQTVAPFAPNVQFPQPAVAFVFDVNNDYVFGLLKDKIVGRAIPPKANPPKNIAKRFFVPMPIPIPGVAPVVEQRNGKLVIASLPGLVDKLFADTDRLKDSEEFKRLAKGVTLNGCGVSYFSPRLLVQIKKLLKALPQPAMRDMSIWRFYDNLDSAVGVCVTRALSDGLITESNSGAKACNVLFIKAAIAPLALATGMMLPAMNKARAKARRISSAANLKQIGVALRQYSIDSSDMFPIEDGTAGLNDLIKGDYLGSGREIFVNPNSGTKAAPSGQPLREENCDYVYFGGFSDDGNPDVPIMIEKPVNNFVNVLYMDGHVAGYPVKATTIEGVLDELGAKRKLPPEIAKTLKEKARKFDAKTKP